MKPALFVAAAVVALTPSLALAASLPFGSADTKRGDILTDAKGMTLYIYDKDKKGVSNCYGECAEDWPPFKAAAGAQPSGPYSLAPRKDGSKQWAFNGMPLYYWQGDTAKGQVTGDGMQGVWHVVHVTHTSAGGSSGGSW